MSNPATINMAIADAYTTAEAIELVSRAGVKKGNMRLDKAFLSAVSAGCLLSFAAAASLSANTAPWFQANAPGLIRMISALIFPIGLVMIVLAGADLFTGTNLYTAVAVLHGRLSIWKMLVHWFICFWGNLAGSLFVTAIICGYGGIFDHSPYRDQAIATAIEKQVSPQFHQIFLRAVGCNWLVCLGCCLGMQGKELISKIAGIWWPTFASATLGLDHVVANMFFIPLGIWLQTPGLSVGMYIWKGIIPATLGNMVGGAVFCAGFYHWMFLSEEPENPR
ncbi:Formate/nitrite transporter [Lasiosphaeria miniovina]|uniref:Formate/nitrite transporter n=1 Tax=Lasiosphaeria miniovina TaxID=1954250 RepID=A0AA40EDN2_9PEZI|nr:Formate/nitrite transporter [Lasiosphaeria miniovina]KAK0734527.1 Formate/nitrite transporter [Lasiosphaeria miniovina]